jgi:hypothetical protein
MSEDEHQEIYEFDNKEVAELILKLEEYLMNSI